MLCGGDAGAAGEASPDADAHRPRREALREDEIACRAMGLNHVLVKLSAFMLGASTAGIAGVFFASYQGFVNPTSFTFLSRR